MSATIYKVGESTWVDFWQSRLASKTLLVETRVDVKYAGDIDLDADTFNTRFVLYLRVPKSDLYESAAERRLDPAGAFVVAGRGGERVEEWWPWVEFNGTVKSKGTWARDKGDAIVFGYEVEATFSTADNTTGGWYPLDYHSLSIKLTSNWDAEKLRFVPWNGGWTVEMADATLTTPVSVVDAKCCRFRNMLKHKRTLHHLWIATPIPRLRISASDGFTGRFSYSEAEVSIFVNRRLSYHSTYELIRPFALGLLCPISLTAVDDKAARLTYNVSLILAMSFGFLAAKAKRVLLADYYKLSMFVFSSACLLFAITPDEVPEFFYALGAWGLFAIIHGIFVVRIAVSLPKRWREWNAHRDVEANSTDALLQGMAHGVAALVPGGATAASERQRKLIRNQTFGDEG